MPVQLPNNDILGLVARPGKASILKALNNYRELISLETFVDDYIYEQGYHHFDEEHIPSNISSVLSLLQTYGLLTIETNEEKNFSLLLTRSGIDVASRNPESEFQSLNIPQLGMISKPRMELLLYLLENGEKKFSELSDGIESTNIDRLINNHPHFYVVNKKKQFHRTSPISLTRTGLETASSLADYFTFLSDLNLKKEKSENASQKTIKSRISHYMWGLEKEQQGFSFPHYDPRRQKREELLVLSPAD